MAALWSVYYCAQQWSGAERVKWMDESLDVILCLVEGHRCAHTHTLHSASQTGQIRLVCLVDKSSRVSEAIVICHERFLMRERVRVVG